MAGGGTGPSRDLRILCFSLTVGAAPKSGAMAEVRRIESYVERRRNRNRQQWGRAGGGLHGFPRQFTAGCYSLEVHGHELFWGRRARW